MSNNSITFINQLAPDSKIAFHSELAVEKNVSYGDLRVLSRELNLICNKSLIILRIENSPEVLAFYAAAMEAKIPVMLLDEEIPKEQVDKLVKTYLPGYLVNFQFSFDGFSDISLENSKIHFQCSSLIPSEVNENLGLLLATSGSTGSPKFVRLSHLAIRSNADSISQALHLDENEKAITTLPSSYTYGLSVINSHLHVGGSIVVTQLPLISSDFWALVKNFEVTSFAGVPTSYLLLKQMKWSPKEFSSLRYVTQAGGRLQDKDRQYFLDLFEEFGVDFVVMYGQTEATARITICPKDILKLHISAAGIVIPGGAIHIANPDANGIGEVIYKGPNVMMGYAESAKDLILEDSLKGELVTGDLGYLSDFVLYLTGRTKRIVKIFGVRVSLDDVDSWLSDFGKSASVQGNDSVEIFIENENADLSEIRSKLATYLNVNPRGISIRHINVIPLLSSGKIDYQELLRIASTK